MGNAIETGMQTLKTEKENRTETVIENIFCFLFKPRNMGLPPRPCHGQLDLQLPRYPRHSLIGPLQYFSPSLWFHHISPLLYRPEYKVVP